MEAEYHTLKTGRFEKRRGQRTVQSEPLVNDEKPAGGYSGR
jgi:hypothetical protein